MNKFEYKNLTPFKWFVLENFPFIEADFDALTDWQLFCKLGKEINKIINSTNTLGIQVESLTDYVKNYFDNLDVQEEINNKLNEMAESGQLTEIIAQYLQLAGLLCYNTKNDMKSAQNLGNGSFAKTLGKITYNDGKGSLYKVRNIVNTDIIDDENIIALYNENLVAEKILYSNNYELYERIEQNTNKIQNIINNEQTVTSLVIISDSYGKGNSGGGDINSYTETIKSAFNLDDNNFYNNSWGGAGFSHISYDKTFLTLVNECENVLSIDRRNNVSDVLIAGGYNDQFEEASNIINDIKTTISRVHTLFPNARIHVAFIGWRTNTSSLQDTCTAYINGTNQTKYAKYITNSQNILTADLISSDGIHPNQNGYNYLGYALVNGLKNGVAKYLTTTDNIILGVVNINNDTLNFEMYDYEFTESGTANGNEINFKTLNDNSLISGNGAFKIEIPCVFVNNTNGSYVNGFCIMNISQKVIKIKPYAINNEGNNYFTYTSIRMVGKNISIPHQYI